ACGSANQPDQSSPQTTQGPLPDTLPTPQTLETGKSGIRGVVHNTDGAIPPGTVVYFTEVTRHPEGWAIYVLDTASTHYVPVDESGFFEGTNLESGEYVLIIGIDPENAKAILREDGQARVYEVLPDQMLDIGTENMTITYFPFTPEPLQAYPAPDSGEAYP
ncbi:MAG: hypothetical protein H6664_07305, partial [Ardenticatenaceae bacterium]|nr:hypothetical protein [Ardenticatenaceae bacterium]